MESDSDDECHGEEGTYDEKGNDTNEIGGHAPSDVPYSKSPDMHAALVRLHRAIATHLQVIITGLSFVSRQMCVT